MSVNGSALRAPVVGRRTRRKLEVVDPRRAAWKKWAPAVIASVVIVGVVILGVLLEQVTLAQSAFRLSHLRDELVAAEAQHEELLLEAAKLGSPDRIEAHARTVLGMVDPLEVRYIVADVYSGAARRSARERRRVTLPADPSITAAGPIGDGP